MKSFRALATISMIHLSLSGCGVIGNLDSPGNNGTPTPDIVLQQQPTALSILVLDAATGQPAWGVEFRVVPYGKVKLVPLINFNNQPKTVSLPGFAKQPALDLLSGETVDLNAIPVEPMVPRLLQIPKTLTP